METVKRNMSNGYLENWRVRQIHRITVYHDLLFSRAVMSGFLTTPWATAHQVSLSFTISRSLLKFMSIESVMLSNYLILCHLLLLLPSTFPSITVFSNELALRIRWPKYWNFSISPSNEYSGLISFRIDCFITLQSMGLSKVFSSTTIPKHQFFGAQSSLWSYSHICI